MFVKEKEFGGFMMEKDFRLHKKRTGQWICLSGAVLALATVGVESASAEENSWVARTVEMVKKDLKESKDSTKYLIKWGDTLSVIAKAVNVKMEVLAQINKIANVDLIYAGNTLFISKDGQRIVVNNQDKATAYRVVPSDDFSSDEPVIVEKVTEFDSQDVDSIKEFVDKGKITNDNLKEIEKPNTPDKKQVTNLSDITTNDNTSILLPSSLEEVISEVSREEVVVAPSAEAVNLPPVTPTETVASTSSTNVVSTETTGETVANEVVAGLEGNGDSDTSTTTEPSTNTNVVEESSISSTTTNEIKPIEPTSQTITITERVVRLTEGLPYQVVYQEDATLPVGQTSVVSEGSLGEKVSIQKVVLKDGVEVSRETTSESVNKEPVNRIVKVGTKNTASQVNGNTSSELTNNSTFNDTEVSISSVLPKKETIYTEVIESTNKEVVSDDTKLNEMVKDVKNSISLPTVSNDNLATTKLIEIYDNTLFEGRREVENIQASFVTVTVKRRREFANEDDQVETIISKDIPVITGVVRVGTRKPGYETVKADGGLVNLSSDLAKENLSKMKVFDNKDSLLSSGIPGYLGSAISIEYNDDFKKTQLGLQISPENLKVNSLPTIFKFDAKSQLLSPLATVMNGNMAYAPISESGDYILADKTLQDKTNQFSPEYNKNQLINGNHEETTKGRSVAFVLDSSGSMRDTDSENKRLTLSEELINKLDESKDKVAVIDFDSRVKILSSLSNDFNKSKNSLREIDNSGGTDLIRGLEAGIKELKSDESGNKRLLFFLTDGNNESRNTNYNNIIQKAKDSDVAIYTIGLNSVDEDILRNIANKTGGKYYYAEKDTSLPEIFNQLDKDAIQKATDTNGDKISGHYTKDILKGSLRSGTGVQLFEKQIEDVRRELAQEHNIPDSDYITLDEEKKAELFNKFIDEINENEIEERFAGIFKNDLDGDTLLNGEEVHVERKADDKAYLYIVSDPNKEDTDGDGIRDDKDGTPRDKTITPLEIESNEVDTDGDGWDDAYENNYKSKGFDKDKWNVGDRDLAITAELIYRNRDELSKLGTDYSDILKKTNLRDLDLDISDKRFFENWDFLSGSFREDQYGQYLPFANRSTVAAFRNKSTGDIIISYRGTDEEWTELGRDSLIALNLDSVKNLAGKQIYDILNELGDIGKLYITGHSLGGYEAYHGAVKVLTGLVNFADKFSKVVNFNGPGLNISDKSSYTVGKQNKQKFSSYSTGMNLENIITSSINTAVVHGIGNLVHPSDSIKVNVAHPSHESESISLYPHMMTSFFADKHFEQGSGNSARKTPNNKFKQNNRGLVDNIINIVAKGLDFINPISIISKILDRVY